jgi:starch synthase
VAREQRSASVITIHNIAFQGAFPFSVADPLEVPWHWRGMEGVEFWGQVSMLKAALQFSDAITTVSPTYAREIQTPEFGVGLQGVLQARAERLTGILNGIDTQVWNPRSDALIARQYGPGSIAAKGLNKAALQQRCGLAVSPRAPLFGVVSRLTPQKGIDWVLGALNELVSRGAQFAMLGIGDRDLQGALQAAAQQHPESVSVAFGFDESLAHQIEAGADAFLMPSRFEPCGLNQMYSQAYGTPPVVNATGGLMDSVVDADLDLQNGTGFVMRSQDQDGFIDAVNRTMRAYGDTARWQTIQRNGMERDFGWERSARAYTAVYERALAGVRR